MASTVSVADIGVLLAMVAAGGPLVEGALRKLGCTGGGRIYGLQFLLCSSPNIDNFATILSAPVERFVGVDDMGAVLKYAPVKDMHAYVNVVFNRWPEERELMLRPKGRFVARCICHAMKSGRATPQFFKVLADVGFLFPPARELLDDAAEYGIWWLPVPLDLDLLWELRWTKGAHSHWFVAMLLLANDQKHLLSDLVLGGPVGVRNKYFSAIESAMAGTTHWPSKLFDSQYLHPRFQGLRGCWIAVCVVAGIM